MSNQYPSPYASAPVAPTANGEVPLDQPLYGASFGQAIKRFFKKYATFSGRASRSEFWWVQLFNGIIVTVLYAFIIGLGLAGADPYTGEPGMGMLFPSLLLMIYGLAVIIPTIAMTVRRLHDANFSGFFYFLVFGFGIGGLVLLIMNLLPSAPEGARFDADGGAAANANAFGAPVGYPGAPAGGYTGQNAPQGYQQAGTQQDFGQPGGPTQG